MVTSDNFDCIGLALEIIKRVEKNVSFGSGTKIRSIRVIA